MKRIALSLDFDFFVRELMMWDWQHSELDPLRSTFAWVGRYAGMDLYKECDPKRWADFDPRDLWAVLAERGVTLRPGTTCWIADSHGKAYPVLNRPGFDELVNIDAHHDCWEPNPMAGDEPTCENWLGCTAISRPAIQVYPTWKTKEMGRHGSGAAPVRPGAGLFETTWNEWRTGPKNEPLEVVAMFLARSGAWVPPHLDTMFLQLVRTIGGAGCRIEWLERVTDRRQLAVSRKQCQDLTAKIARLRATHPGAGGKFPSRNKNGART